MLGYLLKGDNMDWKHTRVRRAPSGIWEMQAKTEGIWGVMSKHRNRKGARASAKAWREAGSGTGSSGIETTLAKIAEL